MADTFPPRGSGYEGRRETSPARLWLHPSEHGPEWGYKPGALLVGRWNGQPVGWSDDRHVVTVAGSRAGKTRSVIIPNLKRYPGPVVVIDPKGELAAATAAARRAFGSVHVLDPFGALAGQGVRSSIFNPLAELDQSPASTLAADAAQIADALILTPEKGDRHWTDSAKNLITGLILHFRTAEPARATLSGLVDALASGAADMAALFEAMADNPALDGAIANVGRAYTGKIYANGEFTGELRSIISTATEQTRPLKDLGAISYQSDFRLSGLARRPKADGAVTSLYLVLPGMRIGTHARWLRLVVYQALAALERNPINVHAGGALPVLFVLEEFAALGNVQAIETAAGYMAGFGVKLWPVLQDLAQLKRHYPASWETFLGNAGLIQAFGNVDLTTTDYLSKRLGTTLISELQNVRVTASGMMAGDIGEREHMRTPPLLAGFEVSEHFSKRAGRVLLLSADHPPTYAEKWEEKTPA